MTLQVDRAQVPVPGAWPASAGRLALAHPHRYAVIDVETTGFSPHRDRVCQVAVTLLDSRGREEGSWSTLVDPQCDPGPVHVHGITTERLVGAPRFADVAGHLAGLLAGRVFVAHNAAFDWGFVTAEMVRAGQPFAADRRLCTRNLARRLDLPVENLKLATLAAHWGVVQLQAHDAADDTRVLVEVLRECLLVALRHGVELPFTAGQDAGVVPADLPAGSEAFLGPVPVDVAGRRGGPWSGRRVLVLGGPHDVAARVRAALQVRGGAVAVALSAGMTHVLVLPGARPDGRLVVARQLGLAEMSVADLDPGLAGDGPGVGSAPLAVPLPPEPRRWLLDARWGRLRDRVAVDVVPWRGGVRAVETDGLRRADATLGSVDASVALDHLAEGVDGVLLSARLPTGSSFGRVGPVEFTLRSPDGAVVVSTTLDGSAAADVLLLGGVFLVGQTWWFRAGC